MKRAVVIASALAALAAVLFGAVYAATRDSGSSSSQGVSEVGLLSTADLLSGHAALMREHGQRMIEIGRGGSEPQWTGQGMDLLENAGRMETLVEQLRRTDRDLALFPPSGSVDLFRLRGDGNAVVEAGQGLVDHGREMSEVADAMVATERVAGDPELEEGASLLRRDAETMISDGGIVLRVGKSLLDQVDQLERSLGH